MGAARTNGKEPTLAATLDGDVGSGRGAQNRHRGSRGRNYTPRASTSQLPPARLAPPIAPIVVNRIPYRTVANTMGAGVTKDAVTDSIQGKTTIGSAVPLNTTLNTLSTTSPTASTSSITLPVSSLSKSLHQPIVERPPTRLSLRHLPHLMLSVSLPSQYPLESGPASISIEVADGMKAGSWLSEEHKVVLAEKLRGGKRRPYSQQPT